MGEASLRRAIDGSPDTGVARAEREADRVLRLAVSEGPTGTWTDELICRWPEGRLYDDAVSFRLLADERVRAWGVVRGTAAATRYRRRLPLVEVSALATAEAEAGTDGGG
jgi:hypothetical protein